MNVTFENIITVWDAQIPNLLVELVNHAVFATDKAGFQAVVTKLSETTEFDKFFVYGYGRHHFGLKQRLASDPSKYMNERLLIVDFCRYNPKNENDESNIRLLSDIAFIILILWVVSTKIYYQ